MPNTTSRATARTTDLHPFDAEQMDRYFARCVAELEAGACPDELRERLFHDLWPWARSLAEQYAARLPDSGDRAETISMTLFAVLRSTRSLDWDRYQAWPALLSQSVRGARIDAARTDDVLTRRQRMARSAFVAARDAAANVVGPLGEAAERELASAMFPQARQSVHLNVVIRCGARREAIDDHERADERWDPARVVVDAHTSAAVRDWLEHDVPDRVREDVFDWLTQQRKRDQLPQRTRRRLEPFLPALFARISELEPVA